MGNTLGDLDKLMVVVQLVQMIFLEFLILKIRKQLSFKIQRRIKKVWNLKNLKT